MNKALISYAYKVGLLFACILCINFTNKIAYCALLFTFSTCILNYIAKCHGSKKAAISIILCVIIVFGLLYNKQYFIGGKLISGLIGASLCALCIAAYIGCNLFLKLEAKYGFAVSNFISMLHAAFVDGLVMGGFFFSKFPIQKVLGIFYKEIYYKCMYASIVYVCFVIVFYLKQAYLKVSSNHARFPLLRKLYRKRLPFNE